LKVVVYTEKKVGSSAKWFPREFSNCLVLVDFKRSKITCF